MSKLGLNRSGKQSKYMEPPDKRRKVDSEDAMWDDDFDEIILTQANLNAIDLIASQHVCRDSTADAESRKNGTAPCSRSTNSDAASAAGASGQSFAPERPNSRMTTSESNCLSTAKNSTRFERKPSGTGVALKSSSFGSVSSARSSSTDDRKSSEMDVMNASRGLVTGRRDVVMNSGVAGSETGDAVHSSAMTGSETISPALPGASAQVAQSDVARIAEECSYYKTEMNKLKENQYAKDGQIKILREKYDQAQTEMNRKNLEIVRILNQKSEEKSKKEADLEVENEKLRMQLQFRQQEFGEIKNQLKRMEKLSADTSSSSDATRSPVVGSRTRPKSPNVLKSPNAPKRSGHSNFPSSQTFLAANKMPCSNSANDLLGLAKTATVTVRQQKMKLNLVQPNGHHSGRHLVGHVLHQQLLQRGSRPRDASTSASSSKQCSTRSSTQDAQKPDIDFGLAFSISNLSSPKRSSTLESALCLAHISLDASLSDGNPSPIDGSNSLPDETKPSTLLLPLVEDTLKKFVSFLQSLKRSPGSSSIGTLSGGRFSAWSTPESAGLPNGGLSAGNGNSLELDVVHVLYVLYQLVCRSAHARAAIVGGASERSSENVQMGSMVLDAVVSLSLLKIERDCRLLDLITYLANPVHSQNVPHRNQFIPVLCLRIIRVLIQSCKEDEVTRFLPLLRSNCFSNCLNCDSSTEPNFFLAHHALELLSSAVLLRPVASDLCSFTGGCLLLAVVSFCSEQKFPLSWTSAAITSIHQQMVSIVGVILRHHFLGSRQLTSTTCECSAKVVKGLLHVICEEYRAFLSLGSESSMTVVRRGVSVLHLLAVQDKAFVAKSLDIGSDNYVALIAIRKLFKGRSEVSDHEENEFLELLPFGGISSDEDDAEVAETYRPARDAPRTYGIRPSTGKHS